MPELMIVKVTVDFGPGLMKFLESIVNYIRIKVHNLIYLILNVTRLAKTSTMTKHSFHYQQIALSIS